MIDVKIPMKKTQCSYCTSEYITEVQYDENFENFKAASKNAWESISEEESLQIQRTILDTPGAGVSDLIKAVETLLMEKNT
jgi:hypothetical protein